MAGDVPVDGRTALVVFAAGFFAARCCAVLLPLSGTAAAFLATGAGFGVVDAERFDGDLAFVFVIVVAFRTAAPACAFFVGDFFAAVVFAGVFFARGFFAGAGFVATAAFLMAVFGAALFFARAFLSDAFAFPFAVAAAAFTVLAFAGLTPRVPGARAGAFAFVREVAVFADAVFAGAFRAAVFFDAGFCADVGFDGDFLDAGFCAEVVFDGRADFVVFLAPVADFDFDLAVDFDFDFDVFWGGFGRPLRDALMAASHGRSEGTGAALLGGAVSPDRAALSGTAGMDCSFRELTRNGPSTHRAR